jgi:hypothetical protein
MYAIINHLQQAIILKFPEIIHISSGSEMAFKNWLNVPVHNYVHPPYQQRAPEE